MTSIKQRECGGFDIPNNIDYLDNMKFIYDGVKNMESVIRAMMGSVKECGVEKIDSQIENLMRVFSEKQRFVELSDFAGQNPESILIKVRINSFDHSFMYFLKQFLYFLIKLFSYLLYYFFFSL